MKKLISLLLIFILVFSGCGKNPAEEPLENTESPSEEIIDEPVDEPTDEPAEKNDDKPTEEPIPEESNQAFMSFEDITAAGYYPNWMKPHTYIFYDENKVPSITEGGELTEEDVTGREDVEVIGYYNADIITKIRPNTKVEYDLHGFLQNIYFKWPDGSYNLSPYSKTENAKITYYLNVEEYEQDKGTTVVMDENQCHSVFWLADKLSLQPESTSKPMDFPRYKITFTYVGTEHCIYIDKNNIFTSTMLEGGNYISKLDNDHFASVSALFGESD